MFSGEGGGGGGEGDRVKKDWVESLTMAVASKTAPH